jgi:hypothetical protein
MRKKHAPGCPCCGGVVAICCSTVRIPTALTLTDTRFTPNLVVTLTYKATGFNSGNGLTWYGCALQSIGANDCTTTPPTGLPNAVPVPRVYYFYCWTVPILGRWQLGEITPTCVGLQGFQGYPPVDCPADPSLVVNPFTTNQNIFQLGTQKTAVCSSFRVGLSSDTGGTGPERYIVSS